MAKIDRQRRLKIPKEILELSELEDGTYGVFWDKHENALFIASTECLKSNYCVGVRTLDSKGRVIIHPKFLKLIGADENTELVIVAREKRIYIFKFEGA